jgi:hypothetical protein
MAAMRRGDFEVAWRETDRLEAVRRAEERAGTLVWQPHHLLWNGEPLSGRRVLVHCNHGLGDTLQFVRFLPHLARLAHSATLLVQPPLVELLAPLGDVRNGWTSEAPVHDLEIEIMELAYTFRCTAKTLPNGVPYLPLAPLRKRAVLPMLKRDGALRVGLLWAASEWDELRSIPLSLFDGLRHLGQVRYYSLQQGMHAAEAAASRLPLEPLAEHTHEIKALAAAMLELDLIVTVDCMVAHLAGALGRPVWTLLRHEADWRWMADRADSPWYPTMRLFRQSREGDWRAMMEEVEAALRCYTPGQRPVPFT